MSVYRKQPEEHPFDLIVAGGGLAGLCAAIAAARKGINTAIIQDRPVFGGNSSSEIRVVPYGCSHGSAWTNETGISHEMILEDRATNHEHLFDHGMTNSLYDMVLEEYVRREPNITTFMNTSVRGVESEPLSSAEPSAQPTLNGLGRLGGEPRRILALYASQLASEREYIFHARQFIDATGDGTVGNLAGADFRYGREARSEFGENLAPVKSDDVTMGSTITMRARDIGRHVKYIPPPWVQEYKTLEEIGHDRTLYHIKKPTYGGYWWLEVCNPFHQIDDNQVIRDELHKHVLGVWNYIKNHSDFKEHAANYALEWIGMIPGKREARRLVGDATITEHDCHVDRNWPDGVAYAGWWIDLHIKGGILNKQEPGERENVDENYKHWIRVAPFSLPLRAYYSRNVENLWMTGRLLSVTHVGLGPVRVQLSLGLQGQAVGSAAAYALKHDLTPRQTADPEGPHIAKVRQDLLREDVHVLGLRNNDPQDLALGAKATASSAAPLDLGEPDLEKWLPLDINRAQIVPVTHDRIESIAYYLRNDRGEPVTVVAELQEMDRIWDRTTGRLVKCAELTVPARMDGWVGASFDVAVTPNKPHRLVLRPMPGVSWAQAGPAPTSTVAQYLYVCAGGPEEKNRHLPSFGPDEIDIPPYQHWRQVRHFSLATRLTPQPRPFEATSANNGWAWPGAMPNLWISDPAQPLPQFLELDFGQAVSFNQVLVSFDTNLDLTTAHRTEFWRAPECVRDWRLHIKTDRGWQIVYEENDNYQRRRTVRLERVKTFALRLEVLATNGDPSARVYAIRIYDETSLAEIN